MDLKKSLFFLLLFVVFFIGVFLRVQAQHISYQHGPDEAIYSKRALVVKHFGLVGSVVLTQQYHAQKKLWVYPPPTRMGYIWPLALLTKNAVNMDLSAGRLLSFGASIASLCLFVVFGLRFFGNWVTLVGLLFFAISPVEVAMSARALQASFVGFWGLLIAYLFAENMRSTARWHWMLAFVIVGSYALLIKSSLFVYYGMFAAALFFYLIYKKSYHRLFYYVVLSILGVFTALYIMAIWSGGVGSLFAVFREMRQAMPSNQYAILYQSGPWYQFAFGVWILSSFGSLFYLLLPFVWNKEGQQQRHLTQFLWGVVFLFFLLSVFVPYCQNMRYVSMLYGSFYLLAASGFVLFIRGIMSYCTEKQRVWLVILAAVIVLLFAVRDYGIYEKIFGGHPLQLYDPSIINWIRGYFFHG